MKLLVVGGAGYVGSILRPSLEAQYSCRYLDVKPVEGAGPDSIVGDVNDEATVQKAVADVDGIVWVALGVQSGMDKGRGSQDLDAAFDVNVRGFYRLINAANKVKVQQCVYASSLSVYKRCHNRGEYPLHEGHTPDAWEAYGMSKRLGEFMGEAWAQLQPDRTFIALRLMWPRNEEDWPGNEYRRGRTSILTSDGMRIGMPEGTPGAAWHPTGPNDLRRLFLAALALERPGAYAVQATGDVEGLMFPYTQALELLGWQPQGS